MIAVCSLLPGLFLLPYTNARVSIVAITDEIVLANSTGDPGIS